MHIYLIRITKLADRITAMNASKLRMRKHFDRLLNRGMSIRKIFTFSGCRLSSFVLVFKPNFHRPPFEPFTNWRHDSHNRWKVFFIFIINSIETTNAKVRLPSCKINLIKLNVPNTFLSKSFSAVIL